jgi:protocatechuate 3,4-dioxygenase beta subunit
MTKCSWLQTQLAGLLFISFVLSVSVAVQAQTTTKDDNLKPKMLELWSPGDSGQRMRIRGRVTGPDGSPIPNVHIRFRHADSAGLDRSYHQGELETNSRGVYQFGSVIPGNNHRLSHVHVYINHPAYHYVETEFYFKADPKANPDDPNAIFLEEGNADGEKIMYGRWDVTLKPK